MRTVSVRLVVFGSVPPAAKDTLGHLVHLLIVRQIPEFSAPMIAGSIDRKLRQSHSPERDTQSPT